jgi:hypothetical protein
MSDLYDTDFVRWAEEQAELLRKRIVTVDLVVPVEGDRRLNEQPDWSNIAEEIEGLAKRDRRELNSRVLTIMEHLIRLQASPATEPRGGWQRTVIVQRDQLRALLKDSTTLRNALPEAIAEELPTARTLAASALADHGEQPRVAPAELAFTEDQVLGPWLP